MRNAFAHRSSAEFKHQIGTENPAHVVMALRSSHPDRGHSVRHNEKCFVQEASELRIPLCLHDAVHTGYADVSLTIA